MIKLTGSVGRMGLTRKHDVALVQKIMNVIKIRTKMGLRPIWTKKIDGRYTREMEPALMCLQEHIGQKPTGKLEPTAQTMNAITRAVPAHERGLLALEGTIAVASPGTANRPAERIARDTEAKAPFPKKERKALAQALIRVGKESGFFLKRQQDYVTADGRFASQLAFDITTVPEAGTGRDVEKALSKIVEAAPGWSAIAGGRLAFRTKLQLSALKGLGSGPLSADDKKLLGLTTPPKTAALTACAKACARLISSGRAAKADGKKEAAIIIEAAANADAQLGKRLKAAVDKGETKFEFDATTISNINAGFSMLQTRVSSTAQSLNAFDTTASRLIEKYFKPFSEGGLPNETVPKIIAEIVAIRLDRALSFLTGRPIKEILLPHEHHDEPKRVFFMFEEDPNLVGVEWLGRIYLHEGRFNGLNEITRAAILLHEGMHDVLVAGKKEDQKYVWQDVTTLGVRDAIKNADSYVALVFDDVIGQIGQYGEASL